MPGATPAKVVSPPLSMKRLESMPRVLVVEPRAKIEPEPSLKGIRGRPASGKIGPGIEPPPRTGTLS